jgi:hypothetical protein
MRCSMRYGCGGWKIQIEEKGPSALVGGYLGSRRAMPRLKAGRGVASKTRLLPGGYPALSAIKGVVLLRQSFFEVDRRVERLVSDARDHSWDPVLVAPDFPVLASLRPGLEAGRPEHLTAIR